MAEYKVKCVGCSGSFTLFCDNCRKWKYFEVTEDNLYGNVLICNNCKEKAKRVLCNKIGFFSSPCGTVTQYSSTPESFTKHKDFT